MKTNAFLTAMRNHWGGLSLRDQPWLGGTVFVVCLVLTWTLLVAPPLRTLRYAGDQQRLLDVQLGKMKSLQAQAQAYKSQPKISNDDARRALEAAVKQTLGSAAQVTVTGGRATVTLRNAPADAFAKWLAMVRTNARAVSVEVRLTRSQGARSATGLAAMTTWDGTVILAIPSE